MWREVQREVAESAGEAVTGNVVMGGVESSPTRQGGGTKPLRTIRFNPREFAFVRGQTILMHCRRRRAGIALRTLHQERERHHRETGEPVNPDGVDVREPGSL